MPIVLSLEMRFFSYCEPTTFVFFSSFLPFALVGLVRERS